MKNDKPLNMCQIKYLYIISYNIFLQFLTACRYCECFLDWFCFLDLFFIKYLLKYITLYKQLTFLFYTYICPFQSRSTSVVIFFPFQAIMRPSNGQVWVPRAYGARSTRRPCPTLSSSWTPTPSTASVRLSASKKSLSWGHLHRLPAFNCC